MQRTLTAMYDDRAEATRAVEKLVASGISRSSVSIVPEKEGYTRSPEATSYDHERDEGGFWSALKNFFLPDEDRYSYAEGMSRGGTMISVSVDEAHADRACSILEEHGSVDLDDRERSWRNEGWRGYPAAGAGLGTTAYGTGATSSAATGRETRTTGTDRADETIPIAKEELKIGKRMVDRGRVRVRSYVVETPVREQVSLRDEKIQLDREAVDRPVGAGDGVFRDRTIEATEHDEEAVVSKDARITEEVRLRKNVEEKSKTVEDKVRRTEVEIEDERGRLGKKDIGTGGI